MTKEYVLSTSSGASVAAVQDQVAAVWGELRDPSSTVYKEVAALLAKEGISGTPDEVFAPNYASDVRIEEPEQHLDPMVGVLFVAGWVGGKLADKAFDFIWDRYVAPRINKLWGDGTISPK